MYTTSNWDSTGTEQVALKEQALILEQFATIASNAVQCFSSDRRGIWWYAKPKSVGSWERTGTEHVALKEQTRQHVRCNLIQRDATVMGRDVRGATQKCATFTNGKDWTSGTTKQYCPHICLGVYTSSETPRGEVSTSPTGDSGSGARSDLETELSLLSEKRTAAQDVFGEQVPGWLSTRAVTSQQNMSWGW